jgi:hypothetical protein
MRRLSIALTLATLLLISIASAQQTTTAAPQTATSTQLTATTAVPNLIRYTGTLKDAQGAALASTTPLGVTFAIYNQQDSGAAVWQETQNVTTDSNGQYSVLLGSTTAAGLPGDLFSQQEQRWLGVQVQGQAEQARLLLVSVPYALKAQEAETLGGLPASAFVQSSTSDGTTSGTSTGTTSNAQTSANTTKLVGGPDLLVQCVQAQDGRILVFTGTNPSNVIVCNSGIYEAQPYGTGAIGILNPNPVAALDVTGNVNASMSYQIGESTVVNIASPADQNLFLGVGAGTNDVAGQGVHNAFSGSQAGFSNTTGTGNVFSGWLAGYSNTGGNSNTFSGSYAGYSNTAGSNNVFTGYQAGYNSISGSSNVFAGEFAGFSNNNGNSNAFLGFQAGNGNTTGSSNIFVGYQGGYNNTTGGSDIYIGNQGPSSGTESSTIRIGSSQTAAFMAGVYGGATSSGTPLFADSTGKLGTGGGTGLVTSFNGRTGPVLPALNDYSFSLLSGVLQNAQLSGTYGSAVNLSNGGNSFNGSFTGNGAGLTGVLPAAGSPYYIQNGTSQQSSANFNIDGNGTTGGTLTGNAVNTATNYQAGGSLLLGTSASNLSLGLHAGSTSVGSQNTFVGTYAGQAIPSGNSNSFFGYNAGANTAGSQNVWLGVNAGVSSSGSDDIFIGNGVGSSSAGTNNIYIGVGGPSNESYTIRIGATGLAAAYIGGIYGNSPSGALPVVINSSGQLGTASGGGSGVTSWNGRVGAVVPETGDYNFSMITGNLPAGSPSYIQNGTSQQSSASFNIDGSGTLGGTLAANVVNAQTNYTLAGVTVLSGSISNLFIGDFAGQVGPTGSANTFVGDNSGQSDTSGGSNTFVGNLSGQANTLGSNNTFLGFNAGSHNTTGGDNTFVGYTAGVNSIGSGNTFVGRQAGFNNTTGGDNVFLGFQAGSNNTTGSNDTYINIAGPAPGTESNTIRIGNVSVGSAAYIAGIYGSTSSSGIPVYVNPSGQLGTTTSSLRFKEQVRDMGDSTDALMKLRPVTFFYKPQYDDGSHVQQYGLIAEEVAKVYPEMVAYGKDGQPYTVRYQYLAPMLLNEVQKQYRRAEQQSEVIETQRKQLETQRSQIEAQRLQVQAQALEIESLKLQLQLQNASLQERLQRLESYVATQMRTASEVQPAVTTARNGGLR